MSHFDIEGFGFIYCRIMCNKCNKCLLLAYSFPNSRDKLALVSELTADPFPCRLLRLLDTRYKGIARGVGQTEILGRIHVAPIKVCYVLGAYVLLQSCVCTSSALRVYNRCSYSLP